MPPKKKKVTGSSSSRIQAGAANPAPPVGPALGQHGVNIMEFCKAYNAATESQRGWVIPVEITVYEDRSFTFITKTPPAAKMILKAAGVEKGSGEPHKTKVAKITRDQVREIATTKMPDLNANDLDAAERSSPAPPVPWASRSRADLHPRKPSSSGRACSARTTTPQIPQELSVSKRSKSLRAADAKIDREKLYAPLDGRPSRQGDVHDQVRRHRRGRLPPGCRPAQGRPDGPWHREPPARHRQDRPGPGLRDR
ncbi:hypothetical protein GCM10023238_22070 [Streptomyces heliomycini]